MGAKRTTRSRSRKAGGAKKKTRTTKKKSGKAAVGKRKRAAPKAAPEVRKKKEPSGLFARLKTGVGSLATSARAAFERVTKRGSEPSAEVPEIEEALAEPLNDVTGVQRISEKLVRSQRGSDEDEARQFRDPSLIVKAQSKPPRLPVPEPIEDSPSGVSGLFDAALAEGKSHGAKKLRKRKPETTLPIKEEDIVSEEPDED